MRSCEQGEQGSGRPVGKTKRNASNRNVPNYSAPNHNATLVGLLAIVLFSAIVSLVRITAQNFGATLGAALIYTLTAVVMWVIRRPRQLRSFPLRYLLVCGTLFVVYEVSVGLAVGLAHDATQALEVSVVNYLWPTLMVLLSLIGRRFTAKTWLVIPGALLASLGTAFVVGGDAGLNPAGIAAHIASNPVPYALAFGGAVTWAVYSVITPRISEGYDGITLFLTGVAVALWIVHFLTGSVPQHAHPAGIGAYIVLVAAALVIGAGYACWDAGIMHGNLTVLGSASYAAPVLSSAIGALALGASLTVSFWQGVVLVVVGSLIGWWATKDASVEPQS
ncbi:aromatic amino acid DMT transporter YddG [Bifidobacterium tibiigranuli]|uniref:aromatic amino acid DMT transporter YddG n=1 Tax=Bifidobacterium tibiigranuli TaxID=2172043 RepID=UPI0026EEC858|nr:aromatic amino acid DMT transporter YddG [Bifidobacterium tibiigranuli]MCI2185404.1 aromatic amino acid DMT transporter YddG [Bifidobacterium tibiigranuli]MCI2203621.1 aromatic amino acid DMT transporter YddG [Bifidobacterium tibiigranuli]